MLEAPNLNADEICITLQHHFGFVVTQLKFLPIGNDIGSYVYRVETNTGEIYFLKARRAPMYEPSVVVPRYLNDQGIAQVVAPLPTRTQALWVPFGAFNLILYPFVEGQTGMDAGLSVKQWIELGSILKKLHTLNLSAHIRGMVQRESFEKPYWVDEMQVLQAKIDQAEVRDNIANAFVAVWHERKDQMTQLMARTLALGRMLQAEPRAFVLCHSDIHTANVLVESSGTLHIVDWDQPMLAPKERDLMFFGAGMGNLTGNKNDANNFYKGYGAATEADVVDPVAFAYYRYAWVMQDWVAYGAEVLLHDELGEITRRNSLRRFIEMFDPGDVVDVAYRSDVVG